MAQNQLVTLCTVPDRAAGEKLARALVEERLAACVNLVPGLSSTYRWEGKIVTEAECLLIIKSAAPFEVLRARIKALHPYETPEIIAIPIAHGDESYMKWLTENSK
ncbi:MAG TPA: divalent-cation tolerance protein CutA [Gammaproteobacteria bacterium]|nr:divalent-cation tolerance protein CutA [Gammaproteobacteria bacterium]